MDYREAMERVEANQLVARMSWNGGHIRRSERCEDGTFHWVATRDILPQDVMSDDWYALGTLQ